jgi:hypothetical protein
MRLKLTSAVLMVWFSSLMLLPLGVTRAAAGERPMTFEVQLIWGTNEQPTDPKLKPVTTEVSKFLKKSPLKWSNYFEVNRKEFALSAAGTTRVEVSDKCTVEIKKLTDSALEVSFIGKGKPVEKRIVTLPAGDMLVYGGNAPNETAWLVTLKRLQ